MSLSDSIVEDGRVLLGVCALLGSKTDLAEWPQPLVQALRVALKPEPGARREQSKAARLERHLFGAMPSPSFEITYLPVGRLADRLRADLADLVPFGSGFYLVDYDEVASKWMAPNNLR